MVVLLVLGAVLMTLTSVHLRAASDTVIARRRTLAALRSGVVRVGGLGQAEGEPLRTPVSNAECLWWSYQLQRRQDSRSGGRAGQEWFTHARGETQRGFLLRDGAGQARVDLRDARVSGGIARVAAAASLPNLSLAQLERLPTLVPRGGSSTPIARQARLSELDGEWQLVETHLPVGAQVRVRGVARTVPGVGWELAGLTSFPVLVSAGDDDQGQPVATRLAGLSLVIGLSAWYGGVLGVFLLGANRFAALLGMLPVLVVAASPVHSWRRSRRIPRRVD